MILSSCLGQNLSGTWLMIKDGNTYIEPMFIEFENDQISHFEIMEKTTEGVLEKKLVLKEKFSETKNKLINENRIRLYRMGKTHTATNDTESKIEDTEFEMDYERIEPTRTKLTKEQILKLEFEVEWNGENFSLVFNKTLDSPTIQQINKKLKKEGRKFVLESLYGTYFGAIYDDGRRETLIPIREINQNKVILYGFPILPYEVIGLRKK